MNLTKWKLLTGSLVMLAMGSGVGRAEAINPSTKPQTVPMTAQEKKNLQFVLDWWREVLQSGHMELAEKYQAPDYIQHNPNISTGRDAFVKAFSGRPPVNPIPAKLANPPVLAGAKGDFVWLVWEREEKDPRDPANTYFANPFDVFRLEKGKIQEHWDSAKRTDKSSVVTYGVSPKPPMQWNTGTLSDEEKKTLALATQEMKDMLQYGRLDLADQTMDPGYIQHNPMVPQGRDGFKQFMGRFGGRGPQQEIKPEWKDAPMLTLVNGPYAFMMWTRKEKDPADRTQDYIWYHNDVTRVENGLIKEHWDEIGITPPPPGPGKNKQ